jgi:hypothetical protein
MTLVLSTLGAHVASRSISPREGRELPSRGRYEGTPPHLRGALVHWFSDLFTGIDEWTEHETFDNGAMFALAATARIQLFPGDSDRSLLNQIMDEANGRDDEDLLDLIHYAIQLNGQKPYALANLDQLLVDGGSVWTVTTTGLQRRVPAPVQDALEEATSPADVPTHELEEAWRNAYGRHPDPSDAWDHAIKAVEATLLPIVVPAQHSPHSGHILGELDQHGAQFALGLTSQQGITPIATLAAMLRLMYPNPDRHSGPKRRVPTSDEARAVVHLAVTIVQWGRDGQITRK